jgi:hypothetical protein
MQYVQRLVSLKDVRPAGLATHVIEELVISNPVGSFFCGKCDLQIGWQRCVFVSIRESRQLLKKYREG